MPYDEPKDSCDHVVLGDIFHATTRSTDAPHFRHRHLEPFYLDAHLVGAADLVIPSLLKRGLDYASLGNEISDAIARAIAEGMAADEAACVAVQVAADYARNAYGRAYLARLAEVAIARGDLPEQISRG